jgi:hypothetical protein
MTEIRNDFDKHECKLMIAIRNCSLAEDLTVSKLAKEINIGINSPKFYKVIRYLKEFGAIEVIKEIGPSKIIKIHKNKVRDIIDEQVECQYWFDYFDSAHKVFW